MTGYVMGAVGAGGLLTAYAMRCHMMYAAMATMTASVVQSAPDRTVTWTDMAPSLANVAAEIAAARKGMNIRFLDGSNEKAPRISPGGLGGYSGGLKSVDVIDCVLGLIEQSYMNVTYKNAI